MTSPLINPSLLPSDSPVDIAQCDTPELLNPPHLGRLFWTEDHLIPTDDNTPNWSLLTTPAA